MSSGLQPLVSRVRVCGARVPGGPQPGRVWSVAPAGLEGGLQHREPHQVIPGGSWGRIGSRASRVAVAWPHRAGTAVTPRPPVPPGRIPRKGSLRKTSVSERRERVAWEGGVLGRLSHAVSSLWGSERSHTWWAAWAGAGPAAGAGSISCLSQCHFPALDSAESPGASPVPAGLGHALPLSFEGNSQKQSAASGELQW